MPPVPRPSFYTLRTTHGHQATIHVPPDDNPWQAASQYARASFARDSQLAELRIATAAEIAALTAQLEATQIAQTLPPEPGSDTAPPPAASPPADQPPRGARVNVGRLGRGSKDHPAWASRLQQETWRSRPLVIWDHGLQHLVDLSAQRALDLLAHLQSSDQWPQEGIVVGTPMTRFILSQPDRPPEAVLVDQIDLSPAETAALLDLLRSHEEALQAQAEAEEVDRRRRLGRVYTILLNAAAKRRAQQAQGKANPDLPADQPI